MLVVSNTSPLCYLIVVGCDELLAKLFGEILIPTGVAQELADPGAPFVVQRWMAQPPVWLRIVHLQSLPDTELISSLDSGECEAIHLSIEMKADFLIMDDRKGRSVARARGIPLLGALGILGTSYQRALIDQPLKILEEMQHQGFRISNDLVAKFATLLHTQYAR